MDVFEAVDSRISVRAFLDTPVPATTVREILQAASRAPSGGNLQPWRVHAVAGRDLEGLVALVAALPRGAETPAYDVYPPSLWEPFRTRRFQCGEDLYASIGVEREDRAGRLRQFARNGELFGAPVGLFFSLDRRLGPPQWSDLGMFMQTVMLLARGRGLDTCAQEFWSAFPRTLGEFLGLDEHHLLFSGMAMGYRDPDHPINALRTRRDPIEDWCELRGFDE
ncbi:MAG: nitroreductase [Acidimicrobiales bacterium]